MSLFPIPDISGLCLSNNISFSFTLPQKCIVIQWLLKSSIKFVAFLHGNHKALCAPIFPSPNPDTLHEEVNYIVFLPHVLD